MMQPLPHAADVTGAPLLCATHGIPLRMKVRYNNTGGPNDVFWTCDSCCNEDRITQDTSLIFEYARRMKSAAEDALKVIQDASDVALKYKEMFYHGIIKVTEDILKREP